MVIKDVVEAAKKKGEALAKVSISASGKKKAEVAVYDLYIVLFHRINVQVCERNRAKYLCFGDNLPLQSFT